MSSHSTHQCRRAVHGRGWMMMILLCCCCVLLAVSATEAVRPRRTLMEAVEHRRRVAVDRVAAVPAIATQHDDAHKTPHDAATDQIEHLVKKLRKDRERNNGTLHSTPPRAITELNAASATEMEMQPPFIIAGVSTNVSFINLLAGSIVQVWSGAVSCEDSNHAIVIASGKVAAGSTSVVLTLSGVCTQAGMLQVCVLPPSPASAMHASSRTKAVDVLATTTQQHHQRGHQHRVALAAREDPNDGPVLFAQGGTILILHFTHASSTLTIGRVPAMMYVGVRRANGEGMISAFCTNPLTCGSSAEDEDSSSSDDVLLQPEVVSYALSFLEDGFLFVNPSEGSTSCPDWASVSGVATVPKAEMFISTNPASNRHLVSATLQTTPTQAGNYAVCLASRNKEGFYSTTGAGMSLWEATHIEPTESSSSSNRESSSAVARSSSSRSASEPPGMLPTTMIAGQSLTVTSLRLNTGRSAIASDPLCETIISLTPPSTTISIIRDGKSVLTVPTCTTQTSGYYCEAEGLSGAAVLENRGVMNIISLYDCFSMQYLNILTAVQLPARPVTQYGVAPGFGRMHFLSLSSACDTSPALQQLEEEGIVTEQLHSTPLNYYYVCVESADGTLNFTTSLPSLEIVSFLMTSYIATVNVRQKMRLIPKTYAPEDSFVIATELPHDGGNNLWVPDTDLVYEGPCGDGYVVPNISASELTGANGTTVILPTLVPQILTICARSNLFRKNANTLLRGRFFVPVQTFLAILPPVVSSIAPTSPVLSHSMACFSVSVPGNIYSMVPTVDGTNPEYVLYRPYYRHDVGPRVMNLVAVDEDELELAQAHHDNYCAQRSTVTASPTIASPMASAFGSPVAVCFNTMHLPAGTYAVCASTPNGFQTVVQPVHLTSATVSPTEVVAGSITSFKVTPTMPLTSFLVAPLSEDGNCTWSSSSPTFTTDDNGNGEVRLVFTYADGRVAALPAGNYSLCFAYPLPRTRGLATTSPAFQWAQLAVLEVHGADFFSVSVGALVLGVPTDVYLTEDLTAPMLKPGFYTSCAETAQPVSNTVASWTADDDSDVLIHVVAPTQTQPAMQSAAEGVVATGANNAPVPTLFLCARAPLNQTLCAVPALGLAVVNQPMRLPVTPQPTCSQVNLYFAVSSAATQWAQVELATGGCCYSRLANPSSATPSYVVQQGYRLGSGYRAFLLNDEEVDALHLSDYSICVSNWSTYNGLHRCLDVGTLAVWRNLSLCDVNPHFLPITIIAPRETLSLPQPWSRANYLVLIIILAAGGAVVFVSLVVCLITKLCTRHGAQQLRRAIKTAAADLDEEESPSRRAVEVPRKGGEWPWATVGSFDGAAPSTTPTTKHRQHTASRLPRGLSLANPDAAVEPMRTWLVDVPADPLTAERVLRCLSTPMAGLTANTSAPYAASDAASEDVVKKAIVYEGTTSDGDALTTTTTQPEPHTVEEVVAYELDSRRMILDHEDDALLTLLVQERRLWKETRRAASVGGSVQRSTLLEHDPFWSGQFDAVDAASIRALRAVSGYVVGEDSPRSPTDLAHEEDGSDDDTFTRTNTSALLTAMDEGVRHAAPRGIPVGPSEPLFTPASARNEQPNERSPSLHQPEYVEETPAGRALVAPQHAFSPASAEREDSVPASAPVGPAAAVPTSEDAAFSPASVPREEQPNAQPVERSPSLHQPEFVAETPAGRTVAPQDVFSPASAEREDSVPASAPVGPAAAVPTCEDAAFSPASVPREEQPNAQPVERSPSLHQPEFVAETPAGRAVAPQDVFSPASAEREDSVPASAPVGPAAAVPTCEDAAFSPASVAREEQPHIQPVERSPSLHQPEFVAETPAGRAVAPQDAFSPASAEREDSVPAMDAKPLSSTIPTGRGAAPISVATLYSPASVPREEQPNAQPVERSPSLHQPEFVAETPTGRAAAPQDVFSPASAEREDSVPAVATKPSFATTPAGRTAAPISMATLYSPASVPREEQPHIQPVERSPSLHQPEFVAETPAGRGVVAPQDAFSPASAEREDSMPASAPVGPAAAVPTSEDTAFSPASVPREEQPTAQPVERSPSLHQPEFVAETPAGRGFVAPQDVFSPPSMERDE